MSAPEANVAPHAGAWIETPLCLDAQDLEPVAPHAGAWIETSVISLTSLTSPVAPHAGAWIETVGALYGHGIAASRAPRGRVD